MSDVMSWAVEATHEGDVLRLHRSLPLDKAQRVWVVVISAPEPVPTARETPSPDEILRLAAQVYTVLDGQYRAMACRLTTWTRSSI